MNVRDKLDSLLMKVEKPARYIGGELYSVSKDPEKTKVRFCFAFPDLYEIGMSYLGLQIIYHVLNSQEDVFCERVFAPAEDMEEAMRSCDLPLYTLETKTPVSEMDLVGFTLQYEMSYTNILNMLDLSGIPLKSKDRNESHPFIIAGGPCACNPEPLAEIMDLFLLGDGEESLVELSELYIKWKSQNLPKECFLEQAAQMKGVYVPKYYEPQYDDHGILIAMKKTNSQAADRIEKRMIEDLDKAPYPMKNIVPLIEVVHDRAVVEIFRGCTRGCRFCQAGMIYRPVRERSKEKILEIAKSQLDATGYEEMSILSLSTGDYSQIEPLVMELMSLCREKNTSLSLPSLRLDSFSFKVMEEIQGYKKSGLTFAPEAGSQRLRDVINKNITEENIYSAVRQAIELGWTNVKLYFMIGLPTECDQDLDGIVEIAKNIMDLAGNKRGKFHVTVSVSNFVPKPHTPFQWCPQDTIEEFERKHLYLRDKLRTVKGVSFHYHSKNTSHMEAVFAKGDRRICDTLIQAWSLGCKFDGWTEHFQYDKWLEAFQITGIDDHYYAFQKGNLEACLPWDHIDYGVSKDFLKKEWEKAKAAETTPDCRNGCAGCGINRKTVCKMEGTL